MTKLNCLRSVRARTGLRCYSLCCPPRPPPCGSGKGTARRICPPADCKPGDVPANPCVPRVHHGGKDSWKKYKYFALVVMCPIILVQAVRALGHEPPHKGPCRDYEYMRLRSKKFPWGTGVETFFHNEHVNHLPGECEPPPLDCD